MRGPSIRRTFLAWSSVVGQRAEWPATTNYQHHFQNRLNNDDLFQFLTDIPVGEGERVDVVVVLDLVVHPR